MQPIETASPELDALSDAGPINLPPERPKDQWDVLNVYQQNAFKARIESRDNGRVSEPWKGNDEPRAYDEGVWNEHQSNLEEYRQKIAAYQQEPSTAQGNMKVL